MSHIWEAGEAGSYVGSDLRERQGREPAPSESQQQGGGADSVNNGTQSPVSYMIPLIELITSALVCYLDSNSRFLPSQSLDHRPSVHLLTSPLHNSYKHRESPAARSAEHILVES